MLKNNKMNNFISDLPLQINNPNNLVIKFHIKNSRVLGINKMAVHQISLPHHLNNKNPLYKKALSLR